MNLLSVHSGWCADVKFDGGQGSPLITYWCHGGGNQKFRFERDGTIREKGMCLDAFGGRHSLNNGDKTAIPSSLIGNAGAGLTANIGGALANVTPLTAVEP